MRVILDSNILVAAFSSRGLCSSIFELCLDSTIIIISEHIISEIKKAFLNKIKLPENKTNDVLAYLREHCIVEDYKELDRKVCRDTDDDKILALAKYTQTDYIITGDEDLLILKDFDSIPIVNPRDFWNIIKRKENKNNRNAYSI